MKTTSITLALAMLLSTTAHAQEAVEGRVVTSKEIVQHEKVLRGSPTLPVLRDNELQTVHDFVRSFKYEGDTFRTWKTTVQFFKDGGGLCNDFATVEYQYLKNDHDVKIAVGHIISSGTYPGDQNYAHAVLIVDGKYVLDSMSAKVRHVSSFKKDFRTIYYLTETSEVLSDGELK